MIKTRQMGVFQRPVKRELGMENHRKTFNAGDALRMLWTVIVSVFVSEAIVMIMVSYFFDQTARGAVLLDAVLLVVVLSPVLYLLIYLPLKRSVKIEESLRKKTLENEEMYKSMMESMKDLVYICSDQYRVIFINPAMERKVGKDAVGKECYKVLYQYDEICPWCVKDKLEEGKKVEDEILSTKDGMVYHVSHSSLLWQDGKSYTMTVLRDVSELKQAERAIEGQAFINRTLAGLARKILSSVSVETISRLALEEAMRFTASSIGYIGYIDSETGNLICPALSKGVWDQCKVSEKGVTFKKFGGLCGWVLAHKQSIMSNDAKTDSRASGTPEGHIKINNFLSIPAISGEKLIGQLSLANAGRDYTDEDVQMAERIADLYALGFQRVRIEQELRESEQKFRVIAETSIDLIYQIDMEGKVVYCSPASIKMLGYSPEYLDGKGIGDLIAKSYQENALTALKRLREGENITSLELELISREGKLVAVETNLVPIEREGSIVGAQGIARDMTLHREAEKALKRSHDELEALVHERTADLSNANQRLKLEITQRERAESELRRSESELKRMSTQLLTAQEEERRRLSRELHDGLGQSISAIKFNLENYMRSKSDSKARAEKPQIARLLEMLKDAVDEVRRISADLRPPVLDDLGIIATIGWFCRNFERTYKGIKVTREIYLDESDIPQTLKTVIYRIIQEALNNVAKHSGADSVAISLSKDEGTILMTINDSGRGMDRAIALGNGESSQGIGLLSMKERAELSGGQFWIDSAKGKGTALNFRWSYDNVLSMGDATAK